MSLLLATVVDFDALGKTAAAAIVAGVGVPILFSVSIYGIARHSELVRDGRRVAAYASITMAAVCLLASIAAVVVGILVMIAD